MLILMMASSVSLESCLTAGLPSLKNSGKYLSIVIGSPYLCEMASQSSFSIRPIKSKLLIFLPYNHIASIACFVIVHNGNRDHDGWFRNGPIRVWLIVVYQ